MDCEALGFRHVRGIAVAILILSVIDLMINGVSILSRDGSKVSVFLPGGLIGVLLAWRLWMGGGRAVNWTQRIAAFVIGIAGVIGVVLLLRLPWNAGVFQVVGMERVNWQLWTGIIVSVVISGSIVGVLRGIPVRDYLNSRNVAPSRTYPSCMIGAVLGIVALLTLYNTAYRDQWIVGQKVLRHAVSADLDYHVVSFLTRGKEGITTFRAAVGAYNEDGYCVGDFGWSGRLSDDGSFEVHKAHYRPAYGACEILEDG